MTPLVLAAALSVLAPTVAGVTVPGHHKMPFDDTQMDVINNGGDPNEVLCEDRAVVGSRFLRHICYTRAEWSELKFEQHDHTSRMLRHLNEGSTMGGGGRDSSQPPGADNPP